MRKKSNRTHVAIIILFIFLIAFRCIINSIDEKVVQQFIAFITVFSLIFVVYCIGDEVYFQKTQLIENSDNHDSIKKTAKKRLRKSCRIIAIISLPLLSVFGLVYIFFVSSSLWNDVLSIITVGLSRTD